MVFSASPSIKQLNKTPLGSFQYNNSFTIQNFNAFNFKNLAFVLLNSGGAYKFFSTKRILAYHAKSRNLWDICGVTFSSSVTFDRSAVKFMPKSSQFICAINLASPCPLINFMGLISRSYSNSTAIHFPLFPSGSSCVKMSFTEMLGT
jgi:hypothetical protein